MASILIAGLFIGGCSADVTRFDSASFALNDPPETGSAPGASVPPEPIRSGSLNDNSVASATPRGPYGAGASSVEVAALPDAGESRTPSYDAPASASPASSYDAKPFGRAPYPARQAQIPAPPPAKGEMIEVQPGDTLYGISRRYRVSLAELEQVNGIENPNLKPRQKLYLPATASGADQGSSVAAARAVEAATPAEVPLAPARPEVAARYNATYTVRPGDSLYGIARSHKVLFSELQQVNGISDPRRVKPGMTLKVPAEAHEARLPNFAAGASVPPSAPPMAEVKQAEPQRYGQATTTQPTVINAEKRVASLNDKATDASPDVPPVQATEPGAKVAAATPPPAPEAGNSDKLRWPASGKIIAGFGGRPDGTHNDGVNLSVPLGTEVHAAESGVVAYAGSELKGYGNLVLLRHDNGWVTAYAHNDELLVKRGDKIKRGQVIAKAGKTGSVDQPQVHFELRQGSKPVDPIPYLEKL